MVRNTANCPVFACNDCNFVNSCISDYSDFSTKNVENNLAINYDLFNVLLSIMFVLPKLFFI